jgi:hypothetical protein
MGAGSPVQSRRTPFLFHARHKSGMTSRGKSCTTHQLASDATTCVWNAGVKTNLCKRRARRLEDDDFQSRAIFADNC